MPLEYRGTDTSGTHLTVMSGEVTIANVWKGALSVPDGQAVRWHWSFKMRYGPPGWQQHGSTATFEEAKAAVESTWTRWVDAAALRDR